MGTTLKSRIKIALEFFIRKKPVQMGLSMLNPNNLTRVITRVRTRAENFQRYYVIIGQANRWEQH